MSNGHKGGCATCPSKIMTSTPLLSVWLNKGHSNYCIGTECWSLPCWRIQYECNLLGYWTGLQIGVCIFWIREQVLCSHRQTEDTLLAGVCIHMHECLCTVWVLTCVWIHVCPSFFLHWLLKSCFCAVIFSHCFAACFYATIEHPMGYLYYVCTHL